jgi:hypothetical protein
MPGRSKLEDLRHIAERLREMSPGLVEEIKAVIRHPRLISARIEERSPWLSRRFLGVASNVIEPFLVGMGLRVERLEEELVEVFLPGWWRNQGEAGAIHTGALAALGEFTSRLFWEHHLDLRRSEASVTSLQVRPLMRAKGDLRALVRYEISEREAALHRLRRDKVAVVESQAAIYDSQGRLVAQVETEWRLEKTLALGEGTGGGAAGSDGTKDDSEGN